MSDSSLNSHCPLLQLQNVQLQIIQEGLTVSEFRILTDRNKDKECKFHKFQRQTKNKRQKNINIKFCHCHLKIHSIYYLKKLPPCFFPGDKRQNAYTYLRFSESQIPNQGIPGSRFQAFVRDSIPGRILSIQNPDFRRISVEIAQILSIITKITPLFP